MNWGDDARWLEGLIAVWVRESHQERVWKPFIAFGDGSLHLCVTMDASRPWEWNLLSVWQWISPLRVMEAAFTLIWDLLLHLHELACVHVPSTGMNLYFSDRDPLQHFSCMNLCVERYALITFASGSLRFVYIWITFLHAWRLFNWMTSILYTLR